MDQESFESNPENGSIENSAAQLLSFFSKKNELGVFF